MSPRRRLVLIVAAAAVLVLAGFIGIRAWVNRIPASTVNQALPGPILLVPGYGGSQTALDQLAARLRAAGRTATVVSLPGDGTGDLVADAAALDTAAAQALKDGSLSLDVIGYSAGGVVTRIWVDRFDTARRARRIVTLGSPLHGAQVAGVGVAVGAGACPTACRQLAPGSDLLNQLNDDDLPEGLPWLSIWTTDDETVQPPDSARLDGAVNVPLQSLCPKAQVSHSQLPTDPQVTAMVLNALAGPALTRPTSCETVSS